MLRLQAPTGVETFTGNAGPAGADGAACFGGVDSLRRRGIWWRCELMVEPAMGESST